MVMLARPNKTLEIKFNKGWDVPGLCYACGLAPEDYYD